MGMEDQEETLATVILKRYVSTEQFLLGSPLQQARDLDVPLQAVLDVRVEVACSLLGLGKPVESRESPLDEQVRQRNHHSTVYDWRLLKPPSFTAPAPQLAWVPRPTGYKEFDGIFGNGIYRQKAGRDTQDPQVQTQTWTKTQSVSDASTSEDASGLPAGCTIELLGSSDSGLSHICYSTIAACALSGMTVLLVDVCNTVNLASLQDTLVGVLQKGGGDQQYLRLKHGEDARAMISGAMSRIHIEYVSDIWSLLDITHSAAYSNHHASEQAGNVRNEDSANNTQQTEDNTHVEGERSTTEYSQYQDWAGVSASATQAPPRPQRGQVAATYYHLVVVDDASRLLSLYSNRSSSSSNSSKHRKGKQDTGTAIDATASVAQVISSWGIALKALSATGCTVIVTNGFDSGPPTEMWQSKHKKREQDGGGVPSVKRDEGVCRGVVVAVGGGGAREHTSSGQDVTDASDRGVSRALDIDSEFATLIDPEKCREGPPEALRGVFHCSVLVSNPTTSAPHTVYRAQVLNRGFCQRFSLLPIVTIDGNSSYSQVINPTVATFSVSAGWSHGS